MSRHHSLDIGADSIAVLTLNVADMGANVLTTEVIEELVQTVKRLSMMKEVIGLLIRSGKPKQFIAGANIEEIYSIRDQKEAKDKAQFGQNLMNLIEALPYPSIAAIDGACLGGGLELALACTYRVASEGAHVRLALPETRLGIIPGFGGTQRMPRVVGIKAALDLIVGAKNLDSTRAFKIGLVDDLAASEILEDVAKSWILKNKKLNRPTKAPKWHTYLLKIPPLRKWFFNKVRSQTLKETKGFYPAPIEAVNVLETTLNTSKMEGYEIEAGKVSELIISDICKSLIYIFFATESIRKEKHGDQPKAIHKVGLVGAGVMGGGLAQLVSLKGKSVRLKDIAIDALNKGMQTVFEINKKDLKRKRITPREFSARNGMISTTLDWTGFARTDFVIEAVVEKINIKQSVFEQLSQATRPEAILATNTSALSITEIASVASHPERVIGLHFFNPVQKMPVVEIIRGAQTSQATVASTVAFALSLGKTPIIVADRPGFLVNRILGLYLGEAARAAEEGIPIAEIEKAMTSFGMPMGPFELMDEIGMDIAEEVGRYLKKELPHFPEPAKLISEVKNDGRLGKKNGKGFYKHGGKTKMLDETYIQNVLSRVTQDKTFKIDAEPVNLTDRLVLLMINEAVKCLEEKVVSSSRDVDVGMVLGTGFAPYRGGLLNYANRRGFEEIRSKLSLLSQKKGAHFKPAATIETLAASKEKI